MLIMSPLLTLFSVILICVLIKKAYLSFTKKQTVKFILFCAAVLAAMAVPGAIRTMWMFRVSAFIYIPLACIFIILSFIFYILNLNDEKKVNGSLFYEYVEEFNYLHLIERILRKIFLRQIEFTLDKEQ